VTDKYYVQDGPSEHTSVVRCARQCVLFLAPNTNANQPCRARLHLDTLEQVEYYGHVKVKGLGKVLSPQFKAAWREIKANAKEGLARVRGRPAERSEAGAPPPRLADVGAKTRTTSVEEVETIGAVPARSTRGDTY
jgi:hypothetical protein